MCACPFNLDSTSMLSRSWPTYLSLNSSPLLLSVFANSPPKEQPATSECVALCVCGRSASITSVCVCSRVREESTCRCVCARTSVKHSCSRVVSWWDQCDWLSLPVSHPIMLICSSTNRRPPLGVLQAHRQSLVLQKIVRPSCLTCEPSSFLFFPSSTVPSSTLLLIDLTSRAPFLFIIYFTRFPTSTFPIWLTVLSNFQLF